MKLRIRTVQTPKKCVKPRLVKKQFVPRKQMSATEEKDAHCKRNQGVPEHKRSIYQKLSLLYSNLSYVDAATLLIPYICIDTLNIIYYDGSLLGMSSRYV